MSHMFLVLVQDMKSQACSKRQKDKAKPLFSVMNMNDKKARICYLADIFAHINQLKKTLQGRNVIVLDCVKAVRIKIHPQKNELLLFLQFS